MGVIEKMFLLLKNKEEDLDVLRFIWRDSHQDEISDYVGNAKPLFGQKDFKRITNWSLKTNCQK